MLLLFNIVATEKIGNINAGTRLAEAINGYWDFDNEMIGVSIPLKDADDSRFGEMNISTDYLCAGNIIGEMGLLTTSSRNASVTCETIVQVYFLSVEGMEKALQLYPQLAESIWHVCSIRIAVPLLLSHPSYNSLTKEKVRLFCEKSTMAILPSHGQTVYQPSRDTVELILVQGKVSYVGTRDTFEGPCVLPSTDERLLLHHDGSPPKILEIQGSGDGESRYGGIQNLSLEEDISGQFLSNDAESTIPFDWSNALYVLEKVAFGSAVNFIASTIASISEEEYLVPYVPVFNFY